MRALLFLLVVCIFRVGGQVPFFGNCPDMQVVQNFEAQNYLGKWYEIEKYFAVFESGGMCIQTNYSSKENDTLGVMNSQIQQKNGRLRSFHGTARPIGDDGSARYTVSFDSLPFIGESRYFVLATDYKSYSIVWSCNDYAIMNFQILWFLSRDRNPSAEVRELVHDRMDQLGIRRDFLKPTNQTGCDQPMVN